MTSVYPSTHPTTGALLTMDALSATRTLGLVALLAIALLALEYIASALLSALRDLAFTRRLALFFVTSALGAAARHFVGPETPGDAGYIIDDDDDYELCSSVGSASDFDTNSAPRSALDRGLRARAPSPSTAPSIPPGPPALSQPPRYAHPVPSEANYQDQPQHRAPPAPLSAEQAYAHERDAAALAALLKSRFAPPSAILCHIVPPPEPKRPCGYSYTPSRKASPSSHGPAHPAEDERFPVARGPAFPSAVPRAPQPRRRALPSTSARVPSPAMAREERLATPPTAPTSPRQEPRASVHTPVTTAPARTPTPERAVYALPVTSASQLGAVPQAPAPARVERPATPPVAPTTLVPSSPPTEASDADETASGRIPWAAKGKWAASDSSPTSPVLPMSATKATADEASAVNTTSSAFPTALPALSGGKVPTPPGFVSFGGR
ncbi:hypothetical protein B0H15DRAFT_118748 [Mycena belliarum]|uniref:Uncharacterized protein n=1 Tax=Mycena belliarum TaxID=1033014 RepID=A0AAD6XGC3_9AGAR|nr:hypothetical protein B0H15DRAFT_118748 [Mycena belliae]